MTDEARVLAAVDALADDCVAFLQAMVRIATVNPPGERYPEAAQLIGGHLRRLGYAVEEVIPRRDRVEVDNGSLLGDSDL